MAEKTPLRAVTSEASWSDDPAGTAGRTLACVLAGPFCLAYELSFRAGEAMGEGLVAAGETAGSVLPSVGDAAAAPLREVSSTAMWAAIAIISLSVAFVAWLIWRAFV